MDKKLSLYGFNNLTKSLSFNIYDVCYAKSEREQLDYIAYIDKQYNSERLVAILRHLTEMIGAKVLSVSKQDYEPRGASATFLISEHSKIPKSEIDVTTSESEEDTAEPQPTTGSSAALHLDKSHVTVHTYPEYHPETSIATFRVDIDISTCGEITPLSTLDYLIGSFDSDIITIDYRIRGFTRDIHGEKIFSDSKVVTIQDYIAGNTLKKYDAVDVNVYQSNLFHTKMLVKEMDLQNYLFKTDVYELPPKTRLDITSSLRREMIEIFSASNIY
ncbi:S-adenosylmethionine decarboxylase proenzyme [Clostridia bacterium]|nr:S-adenosylmethionine decarboxylase proenzyme [Clostridia bacterium]